MFPFVTFPIFPIGTYINISPLFFFYRSPPRFQRSRETIGLILSRCRISPISRGGEKKKRNTAPSPVLPICPYSSTPHFSLTYYRLLLLNLTKIRAPRVSPTHSFSTCHTPIFPILREYNITGLIFNFVQNPATRGQTTQRRRRCFRSLAGSP